MTQTDEPDLSCDPITTIVSAIHHARRDWQPHDIAALIDQSAVPRETLLCALVTGCQSVGRDGAHLLAQPGDILRGTWLISAQAEVDQLIGRDRERQIHGGDVDCLRPF